MQSSDTKSNSREASLDVDEKNVLQDEPAPMTVGGIDAENEIKGVKLVLLHTGLCLCTFLVGLVGCDAPVEMV